MARCQDAGDDRVRSACGYIDLRNIHTVVISTQHVEPLKAVRSKKVEGYSGLGESVPSKEEINKFIEEKMLRMTTAEIILKNGLGSTSACDESEDAMPLTVELGLLAAFYPRFSVQNAAFSRLRPFGRRSPVHKCSHCCMARSLLT